MFFLLSGFLIEHSINKKNLYNDYTFSRFLKHKALRINKEYIPGLLLIALIDYITIHVFNGDYIYNNSYNLSHFIGNLLMLQNTAIDKFPNITMIQFGTGRPLVSGESSVP